MSKFTKSSDYIKDKRKKNECYVDGCDNAQTEHEDLCEEHEAEDAIYSGVCEDCDIPTPYFKDKCGFHGGITYHKDMKAKVELAVATPTFTEKLKTEAKEAVAKVAADSFVHSTRTQVLNLLSKSGLDGRTNKKIASFIETDFGKAVYTVLLSGLMTALPDKVGPIDTVDLASQLRKKAMAEFGDSAMNLFFPAIMQVMSTLTLPQEALSLDGVSTKVAAPTEVTVPANQKSNR